MRGLAAIVGLVLIGYGAYRINLTTCCLSVGGILLSLAVIAAWKASYDPTRESDR